MLNFYFILMLIALVLVIALFSVMTAVVIITNKTKISWGRMILIILVFIVLVISVGFLGCKISEQARYEALVDAQGAIQSAYDEGYRVGVEDTIQSAEPTGFSINNNNTIDVFIRYNNAPEMGEHAYNTGAEALADALPFH